MFTFLLVSDVRRILCVLCAGRRRTGLGSCAKASTRAKTGTPTRTGRPGMVHDCHLVTSNSDWENLKHPEAAGIDSWPVVLH